MKKLIFLYFFCTFIIIKTFCFRSCLNNSDCSLNGECVNSKCICDPGWVGSYCDKLNLDNLDKNKGYKNETQASWGANAIHEDGKWHLFVAQMLNGCPLSSYGVNSEIIRAESDNPEGPYQYVEKVISHFAHNPTIRRTNDGEFVLYYIGDPNSPTPQNCSSTSSIDIYNYKYNIDRNNISYENTGIYMANSKSIYGPWTVYPLYFTNPDYPQIINCTFTNPTPSFDSNSSKVYFAFTAGWCHNRIETLGISTAESWKGPYTIVSEKPLFEKPWLCLSNQQFEDPFLYRNKRGFHMLIHSMCPTGFWNSAHAYSEDGIKWQLSSHMPYSYLVRYKQGGFNLFFRRERPQLIFDDDNYPRYLVNGVEEWFRKNSYTIITKILK